MKLEIKAKRTKNAIDKQKSVMAVNKLMDAMYALDDLAEEAKDDGDEKLSRALDAAAGKAEDLARSVSQLTR